MADFDVGAIERAAAEVVGGDIAVAVAEDRIAAVPIGIDDSRGLIDGAGAAPVASNVQPPVEKDSAAIDIQDARAAIAAYVIPVAPCAIRVNRLGQVAAADRVGSRR